MKFIIVCAWCGKQLRISECDDLEEDAAVSHSICETCKLQVMREVDEITVKKSVAA